VKTLKNVDNYVNMCIKDVFLYKGLFINLVKIIKKVL